MATSSRSAFLAGVQQVVVDLAGAQQHALRRFGGSTPHRVVEHALELPSVSSSSDETRGCRSRLLGVMTTSGLRHGRSTCRRSRWKYCAGVVGLTTCMLSSAQHCRNRSSRALECSGPRPSKPCGSSSTSPLSRRHLSSALAMNWSMITWAALTKSPNWASQRVRVSGRVTAVAVLEAQHAGLRTAGCCRSRPRLVVGARCCSGTYSLARLVRRAARRGAG